MSEVKTACGLRQPGVLAALTAALLSAAGRRSRGIESPTRGALVRISNRFNRLIELDLVTRLFTAFDVIYHT